MFNNFLCKVHQECVNIHHPLDRKAFQQRKTLNMIDNFEHFLS